VIDAEVTQLPSGAGFRGMTYGLEPEANHDLASWCDLGAEDLVAISHSWVARRQR
jgi:hypothetical protein